MITARCCGCGRGGSTTWAGTGPGSRCRLHAALCELVTGGIGEEITVAAAAAMLEQVTPCGAVQRARRELAADLLEDLRRADDQMREAKRKLAAAVQATGTSLTEVFGVARSSPPP